MIAEHLNSSHPPKLPTGEEVKGEVKARLKRVKIKKVYLGQKSILRTCENKVLMDSTQVGGFFPAMARLAKSSGEPDPNLEEGFVQAVTRQNNFLIICGFCVDLIV